MTAPLMPKATAVWLVENTALTFRQIAVFCELHELEVQAIADGDVAFNIIGISPVMNGQLSKEEIQRCEADPSQNLVASVMERNVKEINAKKKKVLTPSQRNDKPSAILWLLTNYPDLSIAQICKLVGTTKPTIEGIQNGTREDMAYLRAKNPVAIGLCSLSDLDSAIAKAQEKIEKANEKAKKAKKVKKKTTAKKTSAKKVAVKKKVTKKAPAKKTAAKKTVAKKAPAKKAATKKTVAKKASAKKVTAKKTVAKKAPAKKTAAKKTVAKKAPTKKTTAKK